MNCLVDSFGLDSNIADYHRIDAGEDSTKTFDEINCISIFHSQFNEMQT